MSGTGHLPGSDRPLRPDPMPRIGCVVCMEGCPSGRGIYCRAEVGFGHFLCHSCLQG